MTSDPPVTLLRKLPDDRPDLLRARGQWSSCAMEHSLIPAIELEEPGWAFHHLALPLGPTRPRMVLKVDSGHEHGRAPPETLTMIQAGVTGSARWDAPMESACLYFTDGAMAGALGVAPEGVRQAIRSRLHYRAPGMARLLRALLADASAGQPHGTLIGDAIFLAVAAQLVPRAARPAHASRGGEPWRVRTALAFIHAHLGEELDIAQIADAAATSPYYLNRAFRAALGCSIWQYVLRARAQCALALLHDSNATLVQVADAAGFSSYAGFIDAIRRVCGRTPAQVRQAIGPSRGTEALS